MLLKIVLFLAAVIPVILFMRAIFFRRPTRLGEQLREVRRQIDFGIYVLLAVIAIVGAYAVGKLVWASWTAV